MILLHRLIKEMAHWLDDGGIESKKPEHPGKKASR
jgi:hypothetical protein